MKEKSIVVLFVFAVCLLTRLFFVNSNVFFFDGDEAIVALMGLDILEGNFPVYFYGQNYGLSIIEAALISLGVLVFGAGMLAIKIPMLVFWSGAVALSALAFFKLSRQNKLATALFVLVIVLSPTWLVWSMKARGGYLTSFFFSSLIVYLLVQYKDRLNPILWMLVGVSMIVVYEAQPIWLPCLVPIVAFFGWKQVGGLAKKLQSLAGLAAGSISSFLLFAWIKSTIQVVYNTPQPNFGKRLGLIGQIPELLTKTLGGNYFFIYHI